MRNSRKTLPQCQTIKAKAVFAVSSALGRLVLLTNTYRIEQKRFVVVFFVESISWCGFFQKANPSTQRTFDLIRKTKKFWKYI